MKNEFKKENMKIIIISAITLAGIGLMVHSIYRANNQPQEEKDKVDMSIVAEGIIGAFIFAGIGVYLAVDVDARS
jgi:hypothetical protein